MLWRATKREGERVLVCLLALLVCLCVFSWWQSGNSGRIIVHKFSDISCAAINSVYIILSGTFSN